MPCSQFNALSQNAGDGGLTDPASTGEQKSVMQSIAVEAR